MKHSLIQKTSLSFLLLISVSALKSQIIDSNLVHHLPEFVISATRTEKQIDNVARNVSLIGREELKNTFWRHLSELAGEQSGLYMMGMGQNYGSVNTAFVRGSNSDHLAIYLDGFPLIDPSSVSNSLDLNELSSGNLEQVELLRGSHSTLYGSSAIGGVVNLVSRKSQPGNFDASFSTTSGAFGKNTFLLNNRFEAGLGLDNGLYFLAGLMQENVNGIDLTTDTISDPAKYNHPDKDGFSKLDYSFKTGFRNKKLDAFVAYRFNSHISDLDKRAFTDDDNRILEFNRNTIYYGMTYKLTSNTELRLSGGYSNMLRTDKDDSSVVDALGTFDHQYAQSTFTGNYQYQEAGIHFKNDKIESTSGLFFKKENMNNQNYIYSYDPWFGIYEQNYDLDSLKISETTKGIYSQLEVKGSVLGEKLKPLTLVLGGRFLNQNQFGNHFTYEINPSWKLATKSLLFVSISTGFNAPSLYRLYAPDRSYGAVVSRGNPLLKPESSISYEIGLKQNLMPNTNIQLSLFRNQVKNLIEYVYLWDKNIGLDTLGNDWMRNDYKGDTYLNLSEQEIKGVEFSLNSSLSDKLELKASFTYLHTATKVNPFDIDTSATHGNHVQLFESGLFLTGSNTTSDLTRRPNTIIMMSLTYEPVPRWQIIVSGKFISGRYDVYYNASLGPYGALDRNFVQAYNLADISINYEPVDNLNIGIKVENVFNTQYFEIDGFNTRGRSIFGRLNYSFSGKM